MSKFLEKKNSNKIHFLYAHTYISEYINNKLLSDEIFEIRRLGDVLKNNSLSANNPASIIAVFGMESAAENKQNELGIIRAIISEEIDSFSKVILISKIPKVVYASAIGSDLIAEAYNLIPDFQIEFEKYFDPSYDLSKNYYNIFRELIDSWGFSNISNLNEILWDYKINFESEISESFSEDLINLFRCSGLISISSDGGGYVWDYPEYEMEFRLALSDSVSSYTVMESKRQREIFPKLWTIERKLRNLVRESLIKKYGLNQWRSELYSSFKDNGTSNISSTIKSIQSYTGQPYESLEEISDPLEWINFSELFTVIEKNELDIGIDKIKLKLIDERLRPIRNKVAHMRILTNSDISTVDNYYRFIS